jgi:DNA-binding GntR family transcriptional regulator
VASLDHNQLAELYVVRAELEGLAARLAARHATEEEVRVLRDMVADDRALVGDPRAEPGQQALSQADPPCLAQPLLVQQLDLVHRSMALLATTSLEAEGRGEAALDEHGAIVEAIARGDGDAAEAALKSHISLAFETRLKLESGDLRRGGLGEGA